MHNSNFCQILKILSKVKFFRSRFLFAFKRQITRDGPQLLSNQKECPKGPQIGN